MLDPVKYSSDLQLAIPLSIGLTLTRYLFESSFGTWLSNRLHVVKKKQLGFSYELFVYKMSGPDWPTFLT